MKLIDLGWTYTEYKKTEGQAFGFFIATQRSLHGGTQHFQHLFQLRDHLPDQLLVL